MPDSKDYIVRYNIIVNPGEAVTELQTLTKNINAMQGSLNLVAESIQKIANSANQLKANSKIEFTASVAVHGFEAQLKQMEVAVKGTAERMRAEITSALSGSPVAAKSAKGIYGNLLPTKEYDKIIEKIDKELEKYKSRIEKQENGKGKKILSNIASAEKSGNTVLAAQLREQRATLEYERQTMEEMRKIASEREQIAQKYNTEPHMSGILTERSSKSGSGGKGSGKGGGGNSNALSASAIKAWGQVFGPNAKTRTLTLNIAGTAEGAINTINETLKSFSTPATMTIDARLGENFQATEQRVKALATLHSKLTGTGGGTTSKDEKNGKATGDKSARTYPANLSKNQKGYLTGLYNSADKLKAQIEGGAIKDEAALKAKQEQFAQKNEAIRKYIEKYDKGAVVAPASKNSQPLIQSKPQQFIVDVIGNVTGIIPPAQPFSTPVPVIGEVTQLIQAAALNKNVTGIIGEITNFVNSVKEAVPVNVKITESSVAESLKAIPAPMRTLDVMVRLLTENIPQQLKAAAGNAGSSNVTVTQPLTPTPAAVTTSAPASDPAAKPSIAPAPTTPKSVYTPPTFTAEDAKKLDGLYSRLGTLTPKLNKAVNDQILAKNALNKQNVSAKAYDNYENKTKAVEKLYKEQKEILQAARPLMFKQFQSTAQRLLTDSELSQGVAAQITVDDLSKKKRLSTEQKAQLTEAKSTLAALRAPAETQPEPEQAPVAAAAQQKKTPKKKASARKQAKLPEVPSQAQPLIAPPEQPLIAPPQLMPPTAAAMPKVDYPALYSSTEQAPVAAATQQQSNPKGQAKGSSKTTEVDVIGRVTGIIPPVKPFSTPVPVIGEVTSAINKIAEPISVNISVSAEQVQTAVRAITPPELPVNAILNTEGLTKQLQTLVAATQNAPAVKEEKPNMAAVPAAKEEQPKATVAATKSATESKETSPSTLATSKKEPEKKTKSKGKSPKGNSASYQVPPLLARPAANAQLPTQANLLKNFMPSIPSTAPMDLNLNTGPAITKLNEFISLVKSKSPISMTLTANGTAAKAIAQTGGNVRGTTGLQTSNKVAAPSGFVGSDKNRVFFGQEKPLQSLAAPGYHWEQTKELAGHLNNPQALQYQNLQNEAVKAAARREEISKTAQSARRIAREKLANVTSLEKQLEPLTALQAKLASLQKPLQEAKAGFEKRSKQYEKSKSVERLRRMENARAQYMGVQEQVAQIQSKIDQHQIVGQAKAQALLYNEKADRISATAINRRAELAPSVAAPKPYTEGWHQVKDEIKEVKPKQTEKPMTPGRRAAQERINARIHNQMLPYAKNQSQLSMLTKNARFFAEAMKGYQINYLEMAAVEKMSYLNDVARLMNRSGVAIPWALESEMRALDKQLMADPNASKGMGRGSARGASAANQKPFYDRLRKGSYLFTGQTSFGARTPMAVDMAKGMGVMFAISGAMSAITDSFSQAMEYQNMMKTTQAILQNGTDSYSESDFKNMTSIVREVGVKTKFSAPEVASAAKFLAMAGMDINTINNSIRPIADLALIGDHDLGEVADKMTNIMTTFSIDSSQMRAAANIMASTATRSNTDLMMLAESANYGGNMAKLYKESGASNIEAFADTMAIFGVMGNSGVQGSSAGTALRMMYTNLFNPNGKQLKMHEQLLDRYKISMYKDKDKKQRRSMADIMIDMAAKIPQNEMADMVSKLFRITATSGAASVLTAAGIDKENAEAALGDADAGANVLSGKMNQLAALIKANRDSMNSNISESISAEKQNTLSGLWAQVTSMFTEGVVQAMEERQGGFAGMLKGIRDYFARPETVQMVKNLLDMIIEIGKVMAGFVKIWAGFYNLAPGVIKAWVTTQMFFTQLGTLWTPVVQLTGVLTKFRGVLFSLAGVSMASGAIGATSNVVANAAANATIATPLLMKSKMAGSATARVKQAVARNTMLMNGAVIGSGFIGSRRRVQPINYLGLKYDFDKQKRLDIQNQNIRQHYREVQQRAQNINKIRIAKMPVWRGMKASFKGMATAMPTMLSFTPIVTGISSMFKGLMLTLAKSVGLLLNPITLTVAAIGTLGWHIYKLRQRSKGLAKDQIEQRAHLNSEADKGAVAIRQGLQWHEDLFKDNIIKLRATPLQQEIQDRNEKLKKQKQESDKRFSWIFNEKYGRSASQQSLQDMSDKWNQLVAYNPILGLALGDKKDEFTTGLLTFNPRNFNTPYTSMYQGGVGVSVSKHLSIDERGQILQNRLTKAALMAEAAFDPRVKDAVNQVIAINKLKQEAESIYKSQLETLEKARETIGEQQYQKRLESLNKEISKKRQQFDLQIQFVRQHLINSFPKGISADGVTNGRLADDHSIYQLFQDGALNIVDANIQGLPGTYSNMQEGMEELKEKLKFSQDKCYETLSKVIGNYRVYDQFISADGQRQAEIGVQLNMLPDGVVDFAYIQWQIENKIGNFNLSLRQYLRMMDSVYLAMGDLQDIIDKPEELERRIRLGVHDRLTNPMTASDFFGTYVSGNSDSPFAGAEWPEFIEAYTAEDKVKEASTLWGLIDKKNYFTFNGKKWLPSEIRQYAEDTLVKEDIDRIKTEASKTLEAAEKAAGKPSKSGNSNPAQPAQPPKVATPPETETPEVVASVQPPATPFPTIEASENVFDKYMSQTIPSPSQESFAPQPAANSSADQTAYASPYQGTVKSEPTINININELAHFDRTTVAANAEERDLISQMESKMTEAVAQLFAQATSFA